METYCFCEKCGCQMMVTDSMSGKNNICHNCEKASPITPQKSEELQAIDREEFQAIDRKILAALKQAKSNSPFKAASALLMIVGILALIACGVTWYYTRWYWGLAVALGPCAACGHFVEKVEKSTNKIKVSLFLKEINATYKKYGLLFLAFLDECARRDTLVMTTDMDTEESKKTIRADLAVSIEKEKTKWSSPEKFLELRKQAQAYFESKPTRKSGKAPEEASSMTQILGTTAKRNRIREAKLTPGIKFIAVFLAIVAGVIIDALVFIPLAYWGVNPGYIYPIAALIGIVGGKGAYMALKEMLM